MSKTLPQLTIPKNLDYFLRSDYSDYAIDVVAVAVPCSGRFLTSVRRLNHVLL